MWERMERKMSDPNQVIPRPHPFRQQVDEAPDAKQAKRRKK
jgi:hypothetical protein